MRKRVLVTGGAGFIGSHLCEELLKKNYSVTALDNLFTGSLENLKFAQKSKYFKFINGDVRNKALVSKLTKQNDIIYHLAAIVGVKVVVENPLENISVNVDGTMNVAECAFKNGKKKVIYTSSSEVYGKNTQIPLNEDESLSIFGSTKVNRWAYGLAKALGEHILFAYGEKGLPFTVVRYFNCYGPRGINKKYANVVPEFIKEALLGRDLIVHGKGTATRSFCFVTDTVRGTILAGQKVNNVVNIGGNKEVTILDLAKRIKKLTKSTSEIVFLNENKVYKKRFESSDRRVPDVKRAKKILGFKQEILLDEGLKKTINWTKEYLK